MKNRPALLAGGSAVLVTVGAVLLGVSMSSEGAPSGAPRAMSTPIAKPHATVAPKVATEMNGDSDDVTMAGGIPMHKANPVPKRLTGNGQGNGCLTGYGEPGQCLPVLSPMQQAMPEMNHPWTCAEVRELFPKGILVTGKDTLGLDTDGDRTMCGPGDG
jgi:hypothetical protein